MAPRRLTATFYQRDPTAVAADLLNKLLVRDDGRVGRIVEVEAYWGELDPASHAFRGPTRRNQTMFGQAGFLYVYLSYGLHWCANVVTGPPGVAQAVLLRALEPIAGLPAMRSARWSTQKRQHDRDLCRGPGRLCQALGIDGGFDGTDLTRAGSRAWVADDGIIPPTEPVTAARVGISVAREHLWRYIVPDHPYVSAPNYRT